MSDRRLLAGALAAFGLFLAFLMAIGGPPQSARTPAAYPVATALVTREAGGPSARRGAQVSRAVSFHTGDSAAQALDYYERVLTADGWSREAATADDRLFSWTDHRGPMYYCDVRARVAPAGGTDAAVEISVLPPY